MAPNIILSGFGLMKIEKVFPRCLSAYADR